ncbi:hypothetical protein [Sulfurimonas sp. HSL3-7]|uniref:hypothetical protein n=1 Tax=Sulfonitrofixus jiaomeiensis TaxID=3131938 RepID=UPI0031F8CC7A
MKSVRLTMLSVLLFAFSFFIIHDYVMVDVDADTQYELCYAQSDNSALDLPSQIHDHIHVLLAAPDIEKSLAPSFLVSPKPLYLSAAFNSNTLSVPQRPPLA